mgnify:CR=1 FL=1
MRKRTKRKVRPILQDTMQYVRSGFIPISQVPEAGLKLNLVNYSSFDEIVRGTPNRRHVDDLITVVNIAEILAEKYKYGDEYLDLIYKGQDAVFHMAQRGISGKSFRFTGEELDVMRQVLELHTEQLKLATVKEMEVILTTIYDVYKHQRARKITPLEAA